VLKPGGLLLVVEPEVGLYESQHIDQPSFGSTPLTWRALKLLHSTLSAQGVRVDACRFVEKWLSSSSELWDKHDPHAFLPFEHITAGTEIAYAGGWDSNIRRQEIRLLLAQFSTVCWRNLTPMLTMSKTRGEDVSELVDGAIAELKNPCTQYAAKFHHVFAHKSRALPGQT
jgi:hypothetical protein